MTHSNDENENTHVKAIRHAATCGMDVLLEMALVKARRLDTLDALSRQPKPAEGATPRKVDRIHIGLVDGIPRPKEDGAYVYYYDYEKLERELAEEKKYRNLYFTELVKKDDRIRALELASSATRESEMPKPLNEMMIPLLDAISEPCKGCGKRPVDFVSGSVTDRTA